MRSQIILILTIVLSLYTNVVSFGQSISESIGPPPPNEGGTINGPQLPIDDSFIVLLIAGLLLGVYFLIKKHHSKNIPA